MYEYMGAAGDRSAGNGAEGDGGWLKGAQAGGGLMGDGVNGWRMEEVHRGYGPCNNSVVQNQHTCFLKVQPAAPVGLEIT